MNLLHPADAPEEHRIALPGLELAFNHQTRTVFLIDQTGAENTDALQGLEKHLRERGWYLHAVVVAPPNDGDHRGIAEIEPRLRAGETRPIT